MIDDEEFEEYEEDEYDTPEMNEAFLNAVFGKDLLSYIREYPKQEGIDVLDVRRAEQVEKSIAVIVDILKRNDEDTEIVERNLKSGFFGKDWDITIETSEIDLTISQSKAFLSAISLADQFAIYPTIDRNIRICLGYADMQKRIT